MTSQVETLNSSVTTINSNLGGLTASVNDNSEAIASLITGRAPAGEPSADASFTDSFVLDELDAMRADLTDIKELLRNQE